MTWVRKGECNGCGFCCQAIAYVQLDFPNLVDDQEFLKVRGIFPDGTKRLHVIDPCSKLLPDNKCEIYEDRPKTCRDFPTEPALIIDTPCSYWFENTETGEIVRGNPNV